jgi:hypothetical protein
MPAAEIRSVGVHVEDGTVHLAHGEEQPWAFGTANAEGCQAEIRQWLEGRLPDRPDEQGANLGYPMPADYLDSLLGRATGPTIARDTMVTASANQAYLQNVLLLLRHRPIREQVVALRALGELCSGGLAAREHHLRSEMKREALVTAGTAAGALFCLAIAFALIADVSALRETDPGFFALMVLFYAIPGLILAGIAVASWRRYRAYKPMAAHALKEAAH